MGVEMCLGNAVLADSQARPSKPTPSGKLEGRACESVFVFKSISVRFISVLHDGFVEIEECIGDERVGGKPGRGQFGVRFCFSNVQEFFR